MARHHDALRDLALHYALGTLSEDERREFVPHLATCADCAAEVRATLRVMEGLALSDRLIDPPAALRARVLGAATVAADGRAPRSDRLEPARASRGLPYWLAAAALLIAMVSGAIAWTYRGRAEATRAELVTMERELAALRAQLATAERSADEVRQTSLVLTAADLRRVDLTGQAPAPVASGRVFWSSAHGLVFSATNLPPLPPGRVYQLWIVADAPQSAGITAPDAAGRVTVISGSGSTAQPKAFALTIEPDGGRPAPTGPMFLVGAM